MAIQTNFNELVKITNPSLMEIIVILKAKGFKLQWVGTSIQLTYVKRIEFNRKLPFEIEDFVFSELEKKILREAKIPIPISRPLISYKSEDLCMNGSFRNLKRKIDGTIWSKALPTITNFGDKAEFTIQLEAMMDVFHDVVKQSQIQFQDDLNKQFEIDLEFYLQYKQNCIQLKAYLEEYLHSSPEIELINTINIQTEIASQIKYPVPNLYKPIYDSDNNSMTIYDGHQYAVFHVNTEYSIMKGVLVFFVTTFSAHDKYSKRRAQTYFFDPTTKEFMTKKSNRVKALGEIDNWKYSYFWKVETIGEKYQLCFVCGSKLHFPAIPSKINGTWVYQIKPCCSCYNKMLHDPVFEQDAVQKYVSKYQHDFDDNPLLLI